LGGAAEKFGVTPDLAVYGKALGAGWPVSLLAGRGDIMERFGTGEVNHSGTFNGSVMATAAALSATTTLRDTNPYAGMEAYGERLMAEIRTLSDRYGLGLHVQGIGMAFHVSFTSEGIIEDFQGLARTDSTRYVALSHALADAGVWVAGRGVWYVSAAHGADEFRDTVQRLDATFSDFARDKG